MGKYNGRKIYMSEEWLNVLKENITLNKNILEHTGYNRIREYEIEECENLLLKLDKYLKTDEDNNTYFYFFPNELETIMWLLLENSVVSHY